MVVDNGGKAGPGRGDIQACRSARVEPSVTDGSVEEQAGQVYIGGWGAGREVYCTAG